MARKPGAGLSVMPGGQAGGPKSSGDVAESVAALESDGRAEVSESDVQEGWDGCLSPERAAGGDLPSEALEAAPDMGSSVGAQLDDPSDLRITFGDSQIPSWGEFRTHVIKNGNKFVRASYPNPPEDLIETIWCGVPVSHHERARVMTPKSEWLEYGDSR
ncbi:hypothetical protein FHX57_001995 [Paraburkholderia tropica]|uniref:hypothetical protein n=1 Tax=Paraburkholderia tropica TaxID=92647 RepID=UPI0016189B01|nr:hypothetical protein [Paraburkholderia tropica]MBB2999664.1 hypothetical protein [Paraburkholderia tropica]